MKYLDADHSSDKEDHLTKSCTVVRALSFWISLSDIYIFCDLLGMFKVSVFWHFLFLIPFFSVMHSLCPEQLLYQTCTVHAICPEQLLYLNCLFNFLVSYFVWTLRKNDWKLSKWNSSATYRVAQKNVYTLWHEKCYSIIVTTIFIQKQDWYERCPWILDSITLSPWNRKVI